MRALNDKQAFLCPIFDSYVYLKKVYVNSKLGSVELYFWLDPKIVSF